MLIPHLLRTAYLFTTFFILLIFFLCGFIFSRIKKIPLIGILATKIEALWNRTFKRVFDILVEKIEGSRPSEVKRFYLIDLAFRSLMTKKVRSLVTILGMSVGVGIIVLLLSLGYGIEKLIIGRVARLDELKMIDVSAGENTSVKLNKTIFDKIKKIAKVDKVIPLISVVGRISYRRATTDVLVYAAPRDYLDTLKLKLKKGKLFANNRGIEQKVSRENDSILGQVAGAKTNYEEKSLGNRINDQGIIFNIYPESTVTIWNSCSIYSTVLGYLGRNESGYYQGEEYWGGDYYPFGLGGRSAYDSRRGIYLGKWIKAKLPLYDKNEDGLLTKKTDDLGDQRWEFGCIQEKDIITKGKIPLGSVLGEATPSADVISASDSAATYDFVSVASDSSGMETVVLTSSASATKKAVEQLKFGEQPEGQAVVSSGLLNLLSIDENKAVGTTFKASFIIVKSLIPEINGRALTAEVEYKIIGIIDDPESTYFYVPFSDIYNLGIKNFSQLRVVLADTNSMPKIRKEIEVSGFKTNSTIDTVKQIESLFANLRILLAILGLVALAVASLGMFNTLTVSLLERTREIGGMKAMGMVSEEVQDLFLAEAMIMGLGGGIGGLLFGYGAGELLSLMVSILAISAGQGYIHLNYIPGYFTAFILVSSFVVGVMTGLYPAMRAKKISALNALRYE